MDAQHTTWLSTLMHDVFANQDENLLLVRLLLIATLTLFILLSGLLLPTYLRNLQQEELTRIRLVFNSIQSTRAFSQAEKVATDFKMSTYLAPVLFTAFIVFILSSVSLFAGGLDPMPDFILGGNRLADGENIRAYEQGTLSIMVFAFLGSFIWSVQYILNRVMTRDISPAEFYRISINIIFAVTLAVAIRHSISTIFSMGEGANILPPERLDVMLPTLGFLIGLFPNFFLNWLVRKVQKAGFEKEEKADPLPLEQIEGLSDYAIFRLRDLGIENAQNLAFANPVTLYMRTRMGLAEAIDWVGQAFLLTTFKFDDTKKLRDVRVRTISDLAGYVEMEASPVTERGQADGVPALFPRELTRVVALLGNDPTYVRLRELRNALTQPASQQREPERE